MAVPKNLSLSSFNCRSIKSSITEIKELCCISDLVFIQEHWLLPNELSLLNILHPHFYATSKSAVDTASGVLVGRPYGGTAILYRQNLAACISIVETCDPRLCAIQLDSNIGPILFVCVYMPYDQGDADCFEVYLDLCAKICTLYSELDVIHCVVAGDFNCQPGSRFYDSLSLMASDLNLQISDVKRLSNVFTYCRDGGLYTSWIDHCVCSNIVDELVTHVEVLYQYVSSDHKPIMIVFNGLYVNSTNINDKSIMNDEIQFDWSKADVYDLQRYRTLLNERLSHVNIPVDILTEDVPSNSSICADHSRVIIQQYYDSVMSCISNASKLSIPMHAKKHYDHSVAGWNDYVDEKHTEARGAFLEWVASGRPRHGLSFTLMNKTRATFKLALRYCRQHEDMLKANLYAKSLSDKEYRSFWSSIHKSTTGKTAQHANIVSGCHGDENISEMWRNHFEQLYNSVQSDSARSVFNNRMSACCDVKDAVS